MKYEKIRSFVSLIGLAILLNPLLAQAKHEIRPDAKWGDVRQAVRSLDWDALGGERGEVAVEALSPELCKVTLRYSLKKEVRQDNWALRVEPAFVPTFHWAPHLTPTDQHVIDQHVFRTPAMLLQDRENTLVIMPDTKNEYTAGSYRVYMDLDAGKNVLSLGMSCTKVTDHVLFEKQPGAVFPKGELTFSFYVMAYQGNQVIQSNPFRPILDLYWRREGQAYFKKADLSKDLFETYCEHAYTWAFDTWKESVWQEFSLDGKRVGAPVFIVNVTQSPNYPGEVNERETRAVWNQAWFSSIRSASGLYRYARRTKNEELRRKALLAKELALSAPQKEGLFYGVIATEMEDVEIKGKKYNRSKGWDTYYWGNSNRNPVTWDIRKSPFHVLDMSWTAYYMLQWYDELEKDNRLLAYAERYGEALIRLQDAKGYYPAWIDTETGKPLRWLSDSPESSMSALFLLKLAALTGKSSYRESALKALRVVTDEVVPASRWEDFETYWSCCRWGSDRLPGKKVERNNTYKQCNFSMFWTADALREAFQVTGDSAYLRHGTRVLDELLMTQASWQPDYIYVDAVGGFGVLNSDGEWNDARGSLFSELLLTYGKLLGQKEYTERGLLALKTSFSMMYCPQNPRSKEQWEKAWPFFSPKDYGFMMENYGHGGATSPEGEGMGEFTIFDWGNGAAAEAYNRILDHWGEDVFRKSERIVPSDVQKVSRVTGMSGIGETLPNPVPTDTHFDVGGTDLGIGWDMGNGKTGWWFGDTYGKSFSPVPQGGPSNMDNWRSNVLAFSADLDMEDGFTIRDMVLDSDGRAKELIYGAKDTTGQGDWTSIPTAAIRVGNVDYVHFMNVRKWLEAGNWSTNYSAVYRSTDNGKNWNPSGIRFDAGSNFSQVCYAKQGGYVYMVGTRSGRLHPAYLWRIPENEMENRERYQYWNREKGWIPADEAAATPIVEDAIGELSLLYHKKYKRWVMTYMSGKEYRIVLRSAEQITGPWSEAETLVRGEKYPGLYGAFMHPLMDDGDTFYFMMSQWGPYNVFLMKSKIRLE